MKPWILSIALSAGIATDSSAQVLPVDSITGRVTYTGVVQVDSTTADELFSRATLWYAATFKSAKAAMDLSDRATGVIVSDPDANFTAFYVKKNGAKVEDGHITFKLTIQCKEGRFRYTLTDLAHKGSTCSMGSLDIAKSNNMCLWQKLWDSMREEAHTSAVELIQGLTKSMKSRTAADGGDW